MTVSILYAPSVAPDLPQCEAIRKGNYANDTENTNRQCKWSARYEINGVCLCSKHAQKEALRILVSQKPVCVRHSFDGHGWEYMDSGSGSDWLERAMKLPDAEMLYDGET